MEEIRLLHEVIGELIDNGYLLQSEISEYFQILKNSKTEISASEFKVDNIYKCYDETDSEEVIVFAVSSAKYGLKAISISIVTAEEVESLIYSLFHKIWFYLKDKLLH